ncbi:MAG: division/cell wall cluster transcriptional repressor MraZ [Alphaproteobacteria bacterium]
MSLFLSTFINKIDRKGRVSVPSSFRTALSAQSFQGVVLFRSYTQSALEGCGIDRMQTLSNSLDRLDLFSETHEDLASALFADTHQLAWDPEGRIMLPEHLRHFAHIDDTAAFVGRGATFQIWSPKAFNDHQEKARARIKQGKATLQLKENL